MFPEKLNEMMSLFSSLDKKSLSLLLMLAAMFLSGHGVQCCFHKVHGEPGK